MGMDIESRECGMDHGSAWFGMDGFLFSCAKLLFLFLGYRCFIMYSYYTLPMPYLPFILRFFLEPGEVEEVVTGDPVD